MASNMKRVTTCGMVTGVSNPTTSQKPQLSLVSTIMIVIWVKTTEGHHTIIMEPDT